MFWVYINGLFYLEKKHVYKHIINLINTAVNYCYLPVVLHKHVFVESHTESHSSRPAVVVEREGGIDN